MRFFLPSAQSVLQRLCGLSPAQADMLCRSLRAEVSEAATPAGLEELAAQIGLSPDSAQELVQYARFLGRYHLKEEISVGSVAAALAKVAGEYGLQVKDPASAAQVVVKVLAKAKDLVADSKAQVVESGLGNELDDFSTLVELRPVFDVTRERIKAWVLGITAQLSYTTPAGEEQSVFLALSEQDLDCFAEAVATARKKMEKLKAAAAERGLQ